MLPPHAILIAQAHILGGAVESGRRSVPAHPGYTPIDAGNCRSGWRFERVFDFGHDVGYPEAPRLLRSLWDIALHDARE